MTASFARPEQIPVIERGPLLDHIADGIASVEKLNGGYLRFVFFRTRKDQYGVVYREVLPHALVMHADIIPLCRRQTDVALNGEMSGPLVSISPPH